MKIKKMWLELILIANLCLENKCLIETERHIECSGSSSLAVGEFFKDVWNKSDWSDFVGKISSNISSSISTHKSVSADVSEKGHSVTSTLPSAHKSVLADVSEQRSSVMSSEEEESNSLPLGWKRKLRPRN